MHALVLPAFVAGSLIAAGGVSMEIINLRRIREFSERYELDPNGFVEGEFQRVRSFMGWFRYTILGSSILIVGGLSVFLLVRAPIAGAIGLMMIVLGATGLVVDHFSRSRASRYLEHLTLLRGDS